MYDAEIATARWMSAGIIENGVSTTSQFAQDRSSNMASNTRSVRVRDMGIKAKSQHLPETMWLDVPQCPEATELQNRLRRAFEAIHHLF